MFENSQYEIFPSLGLEVRNLRQNPKQTLEVLFEKQSFQYIINRDGGIILGPRLVDIVLNNCGAGRFLVKPDAIGFKVVEDGLILKRLYEFKSGKHNGCGHKLDGFTELLAFLRTTPSLFRDKIAQFIDDVLVLPPIIIPDSSEVEVIFFGAKNPYGRRGIFLPMTDFRVTYYHLPYNPESISIS